jgi:DDE superfamily endonuclease
VETIEYRTVAAGHSVAAEEWLAEFDCGFARIAGRFGRVEPRRRARAYLLGLLSDVNTRRCWQLAEHAGDRSPHRIQRLLGEAVWDADKVRDDVRGYVVDELGDPEGVLILDDTGDLKKGSASVGTQRQYTGTAGRIENSQVAVFLAYACPRTSRRPEADSLDRQRDPPPGCQTRHHHAQQTHWLAWSRRRRLHQARAKTSHYRSRGQLIDRPAST